MITFSRMTGLEDISRYKEELLDVREILKQRKERFRINDSIFEESIADKATAHKAKDGSDNDTAKCTKSNERNVVPKVQKIDFKRSGLKVFNDAAANQLFDEDSVYDKFIQTKPNNHPIFGLSKEELYQNIVKGLLKHKVKMQDILNHISKFLFFLMSGHSSVFLVEACFETLKYALQNTSKAEDVRPWMPSVEDIKAVFVNYGASKEILELNDIPIPKEYILNEQNFECLPNKLTNKNIYLVFKYIHFVLSHSRKNYSVEELDQLLIMFLIVSLDKYFLHTETHSYALIAKCCRKILDTYPEFESEEDEKISELGKIIYTKMRNINAIDLHFVINCCVTSPTLGHRLGQAISYSMLNDRVHFLKHVKHFYEVTAKDIRRMLSGHRIRELDYYSQFYILMILDRCITTMIFTTNHQAHLAPISNLLSHLKINLPEDDDPIDYHILKELITRMAALWKLSIAEMV